MKTIQIIKSLSKTQHKKRYKQFWRNHWVKLSIQEWIDLLTGKMGVIYPNRNYSALITQAVEKLKLERKITEEEASNLLAMLKSPDSENKYMALCVMYKHKPKEFKRIKNVETT